MGSREAPSGDIADFYLSRGDGEPSLFQIWERAEARGDSVTPSTYCQEYRRWMRDKLIAVLGDTGGSGLLSLGSGNAAVERGIARKGYRVLCVDALQEAVELAAAKGMEAVRADIANWAPAELWPVIYMDGVLGHLYNAASGISPILSRVRSWLTGHDGAPGNGAVVVSNDSTKNGELVQAAPGVIGFYWLSEAYLREQALRAGFRYVSVETFVYERPLSGQRFRSVLTARVRD